MSAKDRFHDAVKQGLQKESWTITHDLLWLEFSEEDLVKIDLGAEKLIGAMRDNVKIAVEVKSFLRDSAITDFHLALGQFLNYRLALEQMEPDRTLYLAVPIAAYESFFRRELPKVAIQTYQVKLIVYDPTNEEPLQWIS